MQNNLEIFITNETGQAFKIDVFDDADFAPRIYKREVNPDELSKAVGDYTLSLKLPRTARNHELFNFAHKIESQFGFLNLRPYKCEVYANSYLILSGEIELDKYTPSAIEATIYGENIAWKSTFEGKKLRDIESFNTFRYSGTFGPQINNWDIFTIGGGDLVSFAEVWTSDENSETFRGNKIEMQFPFMVWGNLGYPNPTNPPWQGFDQINPSSLFGEQLYETANYEYGNYMLRNSERPFSYTDAHPSNYLKTTIRKIFQDTGYEVVGKFMEDGSTDNILIPFVGDADTLRYAYNWGVLGKFKAQQIRKTAVAILQNSAHIWFPPGVYENYGMFSPAFAPQLQSTNFRWFDIKGDPTFNYSYTPAPFPNVNDWINNSDQWDYRSTVSQNSNFSDFNMYICPIFGKYNIKGSITIENDCDDAILVRLLFPNDYEPTKQPPYIDANTLTILNPQNIVYDGGIVNIPANSQKTLAFDFEYQYTESTSPNIKPLIYTSVPTQSITKLLYFNVNNFEITPIVNNDTIREEINPALFLPDLTIQEFISEINKLYNLQFTIKGNIVSIDYKNKSQLYLQSAVDWTNKCDLMEADIERTAGQNNYKFTVPEYENLAIKDSLNTFTYNNPIKNNTTLTLESEFVQAGERNMKWLSIPQSGSTTIRGNNITIISHCPNSEYENSLGEVYEGTIETDYNQPPTLLKWGGLTTTPPQSIWVGFRLALNNLIQDFNFNIANVVSNSDFIFRDKFPTSTAVPINPQQLFNTYISELSFLSKSALITVPVYLTPQDVSELDVRRPIIIDDNLFQLVEIMGYNPARDGLTKVKLLRL